MRQKWYTNTSMNRRMTMRAALVTMNVKAGQCAENVQYMKQQIKRAKEDGADLIVFPQNAVSGYFVRRCLVR